MLVLEVSGKGHDRSEVELAMPWLRDALLQALSTPEILRAGTVSVDVATLKHRVRLASDEVLGTGVVHGVLVTNMHEIVSG